MLADPCADPGIFAGVSRLDCQKTALTTFVLFIFCPQLLLYYSGLLMGFFFKENYNFTRFRGWGRVSNIFKEGPTFSRGVKLFPGG